MTRLERLIGKRAAAVLVAIAGPGADAARSIEYFCNEFERDNLVKYKD